MLSFGLNHMTVPTLSVDQLCDLGCALGNDLDHPLEVASPTELTVFGLAKDADRVLVDADDQLGTVAQISEIMRGGYRGPLSFEVFSPDVHALTDPKAMLSRSIRFIENEVLALAA